MAQYISIEEAWGKPFHPDENAGHFQPTHKQPEKMPLIPRADMSKIKPMETGGDIDEDDQSVTQNPSYIPSAGDDETVTSGATTQRTHVFSRDSIEDTPLSNAPVGDAYLLSDEMRALQQKISASFANSDPSAEASSPLSMVTLGDIFAKLNEVLLTLVGDKDGATKKENRSPLIDGLILAIVGIFVIYILDMILRLGQNMAKATIRFA